MSSEIGLYNILCNTNKLKRAFNSDEMGLIWD